MNLHITQKGQEEVRRRAFKLSLKKRSVLFLLDKPKSLAHVLAKSIYPRIEIVEEIAALVEDGFIEFAEDAIARHSPPVSSSTEAKGAVHLDDEIILSEAKFKLTDFSMDSFGMQSQAFVDAIRACNNVKDLELCLSAIFAATGKHCPDRLPILVGLVKEANESA